MSYEAFLDPDGTRVVFATGCGRFGIMTWPAIFAPVRKSSKAATVLLNLIHTSLLFRWSILYSHMMS